jgi:colicin import membrane protein
MSENTDTSATPEVEPSQAPEQAPAPAAAAPTPAASQQLELEPETAESQPPVESDPVYRAAIERAKVEAAEAERARLAAREEQIRAEATQAAEERMRNEAAEAKRVAEMGAQERLEHELEKQKAANAERDEKIKAAEANAAEANSRLAVTQALSDAGLRLASRADGTPDEALRRVAFERVAEKIAAGVPIAEAVSELHKTDPALFAAPPAVAPELTSTSAGQGQARGSVSTARAPSAGAEFNALKLSKSDYERWKAGNGYLDHVTEVRLH